jgi:5'-nucleotidase
MTRILVDMDDVICNWSQGYDDAIARLRESPNPHISRAAMGVPSYLESTSWDLMADRTTEERMIIFTVFAEPDFYANLTPITGALKALAEMEAAGHDVHIVSTPMPSNVGCASDKLAWVSRYLGEKWRQRVILTNDKTLIYGEVLFDDKGNITGGITPTWEQVLIDMPHNQHSGPELVRADSLIDWKIALEKVFV